MRIAIVFFMCLVTTTDAATTIKYPEETSPTYAICSDGNYGPSGVISSPNYPGNYYNYLNCDDYIYGTSGTSMSYIFKSFNTEQCCDYVTISCPNNASFIPQQFSGTSLPDPVSIPWCSFPLVNFRTDGSGTANGFSLDYYVSDGGCGNTVYKGSFGYVTSPNYPSYYGLNHNCSNIIWAPQRSTFVLYFQDFQMDTSCTRDWLQISCLDNSSVGPYLFCGYLDPFSLYIYGCTQVLLWFHSDGSIIFPGFNIQYSVYPESGTETTMSYPTTVTTDPADCFTRDPGINTIDGLFTNPHSENRPHTFYFGYLPGPDDASIAECQSRCSLEPPCFSFTFISNSYTTNVTWMGECMGRSNEYDIKVPFEYATSGERCSGGENGTSSSRYTGTTYPPTVTIAPVCGNSTHTDSYGVLSSPNYPGDYYNNLNCDYYVQASSGSSLSFVFNSLHVENSDFVTISCPPNSNFLPQEFSGHILPDPVSIPVCSQGRVNFRTDYTNVSNGFSIDYYVNSAGCGNTIYLGSNGHVNSPFWPDSYGYNQNCSNIIWATEQSTIQLNFLSFNLQDNCSCDWLEVSCLDNPEFSPYRYCGNYNSYELYIYRCSQVLLWFHSDGFYNYPGFIIEYTVYPVEACGVTSYNDPSGVISSPNYPGNYSNFLYCDYTIYPSTKSDLTMIFTAFEVQQDFDFVTISCAANSSYPKYELTGNYGDRPPGPFWISDCSQVSVNFHTDHSTADSGFSLGYYVSEGGCGTTLYYGYEGYVTSPNWPDNYGYNQNCSNIIYVWGRSTFYLIFHSFILQSCCNCDWLEISCLDNSDYVPTRYCESNAPANTYIYNCSQVLLWFHSDGSNNDQGFNIEYSVSLNSNEDKGPDNGKPKAAEDVARKGKLNSEERRIGK